MSVLYILIKCMGVAGLISGWFRNVNKLQHSKMNTFKCRMRHFAISQDLHYHSGPQFYFNSHGI